MFKKPFHSFKLELHLNILCLNSEPQFIACPLIFHVQSMYLCTRLLRRCHKRACTETFPCGSIHGHWGGGCACPGRAGSVKSQIPETKLVTWGHSIWKLCSFKPRRRNSGLDSFFPPSFVLFCFLDCVFLCTPTKQMCLGVSTSLQTFAACVGS